MTASIIIAAKTWQRNLEECVDKCLALDYPDFELIVLPDEPVEQGRFSQGTVPVHVPISIIPTGPVSPAQKRDISLKYAKGEILAFLDDDAYPEKNWLKNAVENFKDDAVAAVAGPAVTPDSDTFRQKASGAVYSSVLASGNYVYRYLPKNKREVEDYPSCNFIVRKSIMLELCGFNTNFWPGEDTKLCLDITKKLGKKIIYDPQVLVYHHRRPLFMAHLKQAASYALHRGYFVKRYPQTSLKFAYFIPSLFLSGVILGAILSFWLIPFRIFYITGLLLYLFLVFIFSIINGLKTCHSERSEESHRLRLFLYVFSGIILTHLAYGLYFLKGLFSKKLSEEK